MNEHLYLLIAVLYGIGFISGSLFTCWLLCLIKKTFFIDHITPQSMNKDVEDISLSFKNLHINNKKDNPQINETINQEKEE
ncbi:hypothetical protein CPX_001817 [Candidatus Phytoplasma pruni]|uniref:Uncharacterized protein n=1 Tax=Candidatus Phytoplasma pruni TaxID=479893 RepID=A0A0M1MZR4_9MOLU|nr:hypothetical protein [Candidatus Phytoplasma pruni]KOR75219.1 hypothetical protein CPX_001817 [Candidatus Phytoplasma pruni]